MIPPALLRWSIPGTLDFHPHPEGLLFLHLQTPRFHARFCLQGAHLVEFTPKESGPMLFLSSHAQFLPGKPIRGGIPVIFPWFGPRENHPESPMHGFVRTRCWELEDVQILPDQSASLTFSFGSTPETLALWPHAFQLRLRFVLASTLAIDWEVHNPGDTPFHFEQALHPYFPVQNIHTTQVVGLQGASFFDKTDALSRKQDLEPAVRFHAETDRLYLHTSADCLLEDSSSKTRLRIAKTGSQSSVVWNPWIAKSATLPDLGNEEWQHFVCVEQANAAENGITLAPGKSHFFHALYTPESVA
ncbi:MAG: hypothetical protein RLZZ142_2292, partial [Verrucomicrobiota bacterium]